MNVGVLVLMTFAPWGTELTDRVLIWSFQTQCMSYIFADRTLVYGPGAAQQKIRPLDELSARVQVFGAPSRNGPVLFLHARTTQRGLTRLIVINIDRADLRMGRLSFLVSELKPGNLLVRPRNASGASRLFRDVLGVVEKQVVIDEDQLLVFAGEPDETDASHFVIPYRLFGQDGIIDGYLVDIEREGSDDVTMVFRVRRQPP